MGGGGFMKHALDTNRKDRAHRKARREKFNGNFSEDTILKSGGSEKIEFPELPEEQIELERKRIQEMHRKRKVNMWIIMSIFFVIAAVTITIIYIKTQGFEYW